jgi:hypothetical protein
VIVVDPSTFSDPPRAQFATALVYTKRKAEEYKYDPQNDPHETCVLRRIVIYIFISNTVIWSGRIVHVGFLLGIKSCGLRSVYAMNLHLSKQKRAKASK